MYMCVGVCGICAFLGVCMWMCVCVSMYAMSVMLEQRVCACTHTPVSVNTHTHTHIHSKTCGTQQLHMHTRLTQYTHT